MNRKLRMALNAAFAGGVLLAQSATPLQFDVASVKISSDVRGAGIRGGPGTAEPGLMTYKHVNLKMLLMIAYSVLPIRLSGPGYLDDVYLDIIAKPPAGATIADKPILLKTLLQERLQIRTHWESKDVEGYALTVAKGGPKIAPQSIYPALLPTTALQALKFDGADKDGFPYPARDHVFSMTAQKEDRTFILVARSPVKTFCDSLTGVLQSPVVDQTGLTDRYDLRLIFAKEPTEPIARDSLPGEVVPNSPSTAPSIFRAAEEQLGLKLERKKVAVEFLIVDHIDRSPTEN